MRREVRRVLDVPVDRERLWAEIGDPARLGGWLGGQVDVALQSGARGHVRWPDGTAHLVLVEQVSPRRRVRWLWAPAAISTEIPRTSAGLPGWSLVELFVEHVGDTASRLTVTETDADEPSSRGPTGFAGPTVPSATGAPGGIG